MPKVSGIDLHQERILAECLPERPSGATPSEGESERGCADHGEKIGKFVGPIEPGEPAP